MLLTYILIGVVAIGAGVVAGKWAFKKDDQWERQAEAFLTLSQALSNYGMQDIPRGLMLVAIKDFSGAYKLVKFWVDLLKRDPKAVMGEFDKVLERVLAAKSNTPEGRAWVASKMSVETPVKVDAVPAAKAPASTS